MRMKFLPAVGAVLALAACNSGADNAAAPAPDATADVQPIPMDTAADAAMPAGAQGFVDAASASDAYEIEAGKLAQSNGTSAKVKDFGAMMVQDHTKSTTDLKAAAAQVQGVTVAPKMTPKQQSDLDALRNAGADFDKTYAQQQVAAHDAALTLLKNYAATGDAQPLKDFASKTAPVVQGHLGKARELP